MIINLTKFIEKRILSNVGDTNQLTGFCFEHFMGDIYLSRLSPVFLLVGHNILLAVLSILFRSIVKSFLYRKIHIEIAQKMDNTRKRTNSTDRIIIKKPRVDAIHENVSELVVFLFLVSITNIFQCIFFLKLCG